MELRLTELLHDQNYRREIPRARCMPSWERPRECYVTPAVRGARAVFIHGVRLREQKPKFSGF